MILLLYLFVVFILANSIKNLFKVKENNTILLSTIFICIMLYLFGIFDILKIGFYSIFIVTGIGLLYLSYLLIAKKIKIKSLVSPVFVYYLLFSILLYFLLKGTVFTEWDEFSHWGTNLKFMFSSDKLWASKLWEGVHAAYPPLAGIVEYFGLKLNNCYEEYIAYLSLNIFMLSLLTPMLNNDFSLKSILKNILMMLCIYLISVKFGFVIYSTYIDLPLSILFLSGIYFVLNHENKENGIILGFILFLLPMMKDTGVIFSGVIILYIFIEKVYQCIKDKKFNYRCFLPVIIYFLIVCFSYLSWKIYCNINGTFIDYRHDSNAIETFNLKTYIKSIFLNSDGKYLDIATSFYKYLNNSPIIGGYFFQTIIQIIIMFNFLGILIYRFKVYSKEKMLKLMAAFDIGIVVYLLFLLIVFLFAFLEREGRGLASFPRYMGTFFVCWASILVIICHKCNKKLLPIAICFVICLYGSNMINIVRVVPNKVSIIPFSVRNMYNNIQDKLTNDDKVFLVLQNDDGISFHTFRYLLSPIKTNLLYEWSLGENTTLNDCSFDIEPSEFLDELKNREYTYVYLGVVDEYFVDTYGTLFEKDPSVDSLTNKLYKIKLNNNQVRLVEAK